MSEALPPVPDRAGEYVLGVLRGEERHRFEADMARDPALAAEVAAWEARLLPLALAIPASEPPESVWRSIEQRVAPPAVAAPRAAPSWHDRLWNSVNIWRGIAAAAAAAAIILAVLHRQPAAPPHLVAVLAGTAGPVFTVALRENGAMSISPVTGTAPPAGRVWQLWAVAGGEKPVPIGFVNPGQTTLPANDLPQALRRAKVLLAVTVEPPGGSPSGQPDTPIVFSGPLLPIGNDS